MNLEFIKYYNVNPDGSINNKMGTIEVNGGVYQSQPVGGCSEKGCNCSPGHWITFILKKNEESVVKMLKVLFNDLEEITRFREDDFTGIPMSIETSDNYKAIITDQKGKVFYFTETDYDGWSKDINDDSDDFDSEAYLDGMRDARDKSLGMGGSYTFCIDLEREPLTGNYVKMIHIPKLTKEASRKLFDLFDENNSPNGFEKIRIRLLEGEKEIDLNYIPNIHSHTK